MRQRHVRTIIRSRVSGRGNVLILPRRGALEEARHRLDEAAGVLDGMRRLTGAAAADAPPAPSASDAASQRVKREALETAREDLRRMAADLEAARARSAALIEELASRPTARDLEEARAGGESDAARRAAELSRQVVGLQERVSLLSAEHVRLEVLRRNAEAFGADCEASRHSLEETLRRDLRAAHASLDQAAADCGTRDAKAVTEISEMRERLDAALARLHREDLARKQESAEESSFKREFEAAQAVIASLRRELSDQRVRVMGLERSLELALCESPATTQIAQVLPALESALSAWDGALRLRGIALTREFSSHLPDAPYDPEQLRLALHHVLRNAAQALARGATLRVHLRKSAVNTAEIEFRDDGPGYPLTWLQRQFEPFASPRRGHAGLGLAAVRRALRRWGGDASASVGADGRGACLTLTFASAPARSHVKL